MIGKIWIERFMKIARDVAEWSKDPSTKVGAVVIDDSKYRTILSTGYNGLPRGVRDLPERMERPDKYMWTAHAEENLITNLARERMEGSTVFVTHLCCCNCARMLVNAGVKTVVCGDGKTSMPPEQFEVAMTMFNEAGVELITSSDQS